MRSLRVILTFLLLLAAFAGLLAGSIALQHRLILQRKGEPLRFRDTLYLPDSRYTKAVTLGYDQFMADFMLLRMIQSFAAGWTTKGTDALMKDYFDVITDLDPGYMDAYRFAILAISESGTTETAQTPIFDTVNKAVRRLPHRYEMPYEGSYFAFMNAKKIDLARYYIRLAELDPTRPDYIDRWEGYFTLKEGRYRAAFEKFMGDYCRALDAEDETMIRLARAHLYRAINEWFIYNIKDVVTKWHAEHGEYPTVKDLDQEGKFKGVTLPDWIYIASYIKQANDNNRRLAADDKALSRFIDQSVRSWDRLPPSPYDFIVPGVSGYMVWKGLDTANDAFIQPTVRILGKMQKVVEETYQDLYYYCKENKSYPPDFQAVASWLNDAPEPFGGVWLYDPHFGLVISSSHPNLMNIYIPDY